MSVDSVAHFIVLSADDSPRNFLRSVFQSSKRVG